MNWLLKISSFLVFSFSICILNNSNMCILLCLLSTLMFLISIYVDIDEWN